MKSGKLGFVPARFGDEVIGGAEMVLREMAEGLAQRGWEVDVLTTCARDHFTWENEYPEGVEKTDGIAVRRFPTVTSGSRADWARLEYEILSGGETTLDQQQRWMNGRMRVPELFHYILDNAEDYRALIFAPYLVWTSFAGAQAAPGRTILMPCLHDEPYAYLELFRPVFSGSRALWFLADPEYELAHRIFELPREHQVIGSGITVPESHDPDGFRKRHGIDERFVLYAGRREGAKGWEGLLEQFARIVARTGSPFLLVTMGVGTVAPPPDLTGRVIDLGFLPEEERHHAFAAADAYLQPSQYESFSRTIMESWLAGTLVIANAASAVTRWHCGRSGAGLTYADEFELEQCLDFVAQAPAMAAEVAARGRGYVLENYTWPKVLERVESSLEEWF